MPTIFRKNGYRFHFYSHEGNEPAHVHVEKGDSEAKFWLEPISVADNDGFTGHELQKIVVIIQENLDYLLKRYREFHGLRTRDHRKKSGR